MLLLSPNAHAVTAGCRSDPVIILSNGTTLDVSADIAAPLWDVNGVTYTVHIPAGLRAIATVSTPSWPTTLERLVVIADNPSGLYTTETVVTTRQHQVAVTANTALVLLSSITLAAVSTPGYDGENLVTTFQH